MSTRVFCGVGALLGMIGGIFMVCQAAFAADAVCNGTAESAAPVPVGQSPTVWTNGSFVCDGTCNPGVCAVQQTGDDAGDPAGQTSTKNANCTTTVVTNSECRCPSGAGDSGCREIWEVTVVIGSDGLPLSTSSRMYCAGPCEGGKECEYERNGGTLQHPKFSCKCK
jgi:hypothetical protein